MSLWPVVMPEPAAALTVAVGWALVWFLGHGVLVALVVAGLLRLLRRRSADLRYGVACAGLLAMVLCPVGTTLRFLAAGRSRADSAPAVARSVVTPTPGRGLAPRRVVAVTPRESGEAPLMTARLSSGSGRENGEVFVPVTVATRSMHWRERVEASLPAVVAVWLAGVALMTLRLARGLIGIRLLTRREVAPPTEELRELIARLVERSGLRRRVSWLLSLRVEVPTVVGWIRPTVLIPASGMARLTLRQIEALLAHEIAHIRRHDSLVNLCQVLAESVLFFHPAVWWVSGRIRVERENCCDDSAAALCDGDRQLVALALFALEEQRPTPVLRLAASGAYLKERVRRLVAPTSTPPCPAEAGWAGGVLFAGVLGLIATAWIAGPTQARDESPTRPRQATIQGRVVDEAGRPVAAARVRLYRRDYRSDRSNPVVEQATSGPDGAFTLGTPLSGRPHSRSPEFPSYVLVADHGGMAVGWRTISPRATRFEGDVTLTPPTERTVTVVDADGRPVEGAKVAVCALGDPSSPLPYFHDYLGLFPKDGPLTASTGADGRATLKQIPRTNSAVIASKPGYAGTYAFDGQEKIRLTPSATLSGRVCGPEGEPLEGVKVVLYTSFMWSFEQAVTDAQGRYRFNDLRARGWDMSAWTPNKKANGIYKIWIDDDRFVMPTGDLALEPNAAQTLDIKAMKAGVIRVTLSEQGTKKPVAGARIWGFDAETGSGSRFNAYTDEQGRATFYSAPSRISLSLAGPPDGAYFVDDLRHNTDAHKSFDFPGDEIEITLVMPRIAGKLITLSGVCTFPQGVAVRDAFVIVDGGIVPKPRRSSLYEPRRIDGIGRFTLEGIPSNRRIQLYAETADRRFGSAIEFTSPVGEDPDFRIAVPLKPTVTVERVIEDKRGRPRGSKEFNLAPNWGKYLFSRLRRTVETDAQGRLKVDGILTGLSYRIQEVVPSIGGPILVREGGRLPWYEQELVLAPDEKR